MIVFETLGYGATTIADIVQQADVSRATFYLHFSSKQEVFRELASSVDPDLAARYQTLDSILSSGSKVELRAWTMEVLDWLEQHRSLVQISSEAFLTDRELAAETSHQSLLLALNSMPQYLARWPKERRDEAELRLVLLIAQLEQVFVVSSLWGAWDANSDGLSKALADIWDAFLRKEPLSTVNQRHTVGRGPRHYSSAPASGDERYEVGQC
jgi:AcrR family transcriptional regulator